MRTPGALQRLCFCPKWLHGHIQVQFLAQDPAENGKTTGRDYLKQCNHFSQQKKGCVSEKLGFVGFSICIK